MLHTTTPCLTALFPYPRDIGELLPYPALNVQEPATCRLTRHFAYVSLSSLHHPTAPPAQELGAIDPATCRPTRHGRLLGRLAVHPRWGHAVLRGAALGAAELAAVVACALGGERDVLRGDGAAGRSADFMLRLEALARDGEQGK